MKGAGSVSPLSALALFSATLYCQGPSSCQSTRHITIHSAFVMRACRLRTETDRSLLRLWCEIALTASLVLYKALFMSMSVLYRLT